MLHFCSVWGPLETRHGNREFSGISCGGGGNFLISEREFPVALVLLIITRYIKLQFTYFNLSFVTVHFVSMVLYLIYGKQTVRVLPINIVLFWTFCILLSLFYVINERRE